MPTPNKCNDVTGKAFAIRARFLSPLANGELLDLTDGTLAVDAAGRIGWIGPSSAYAGDKAAVIDLRPLVVTPGMVDIHAHLPQVPITGLGGSHPLMPWLELVMKPAERAFAGPDVEAAAAEFLSVFTKAGTTTVSLYSSVDADATDVAFRVAANMGLRVIMGQCLMDRMRYDDAPEAGITERRLAESETLCRRWHNYDNGRLMYAFTPRFALSCSEVMLAESARMAAAAGAYWQTHVSEDPDEIAEVLKVFPAARDYLDIYDRAQGLGSKTILAHGVYLSDRELGRIKETNSSIAHCPSNIFGGGGLLDVARYREIGIAVGLATDVGGCSNESMFKAMELGWLAQAAREKIQGRGPVMKSLADWFHMATLGGASTLGLQDSIGSLEVGKDADMIAVDVEVLMIRPEISNCDAGLLLDLMVFRARPGMVRNTWVRGRLVAGHIGAEAMGSTV